MGQFAWQHCRVHQDVTGHSRCLGAAWPIGRNCDNIWSISSIYIRRSKCLVQALHALHISGAGSASVTPNLRNTYTHQMLFQTHIPPSLYKHAQIFAPRNASTYTLQDTRTYLTSLFRSRNTPLTPLHPAVLHTASACPATSRYCLCLDLTWEANAKSAWLGPQSFDMPQKRHDI